MVLIQDRILKIDIYNFEMSYKTPEKSLKSNQIYSVLPSDWWRYLSGWWAVTRRLSRSCCSVCRYRGRCVAAVLTAAAAGGLHPRDDEPRVRLLLLSGHREYRRGGHHTGIMTSHDIT